MSPNDWQHLIRYIVKRMKIRYPGASLDELRDRAYDGLVNACLYWNPAKYTGPNPDAGFTVFAIFSMKREIRKCRHADKRRELIADEPDTRPRGVDPTIRMDLDAAISRLRPSVAAVVQRLADGHNFREIGEDRGYSRNRACELFREALPRLRRSLSGYAT